MCSGVRCPMLPTPSRPWTSSCVDLSSRENTFFLHALLVALKCCASPSVMFLRVHASTSRAACILLECASRLTLHALFLAPKTFGFAPREEQVEGHVDGRAAGPDAGLEKY